MTTEGPEPRLKQKPDRSYEGGECVHKINPRITPPSVDYDVGLSPSFFQVYI